MQKEHSENPETGNRANVVLNAVLSFFDGMSCGQIALKKLGIKVFKYFASEIIFKP